MSSFADQTDGNGIVLDASVLINLLAMDCSPAVLRAFGRCGVVPEVRDEVKRCPISRQTLGERWREQPLSLLEHWHLDEEDYELYVELHVDDRLHKGEAASLAFASRRNHSLFCDDTAVPRVIERRGLNVPLLTTLDALRICVDRAVVQVGAVREAIISGLQYCKMATPANHLVWLQELEITPLVCRRLPVEPFSKKKAAAPTSKGARRRA